MYQSKGFYRNTLVPTSSLELDHLLVVDLLEYRCKVRKIKNDNILLNFIWIDFIQNPWFYLRKQSNQAIILKYSRNFNTVKNLSNAIADHFMFDIVQHSYTK